MTFEGLQGDHCDQAQVRQDEIAQHRLVAVTRCSTEQKKTENKNGTVPRLSLALLLRFLIKMGAIALY